MKKLFNPVVPDYTPKSERGKKEECHLVFNPCVHCGKKITEGYYGRWGDSGTCCKDHERLHALKPKYPKEGDNYVSISP